MSEMKKRSGFRYKVFAAALVGIVLTGTLVYGVVAKYVTSNQRVAEIHASGFHFSSDYLETVSKSFNVSDWDTRGIVFHLYNYEKENVAQISDSEIQYQITVPTDWEITSVKTGDTDVVPAGDVYTMEKSDTLLEHVVTVKYCGADRPTSAEIQVATVAPYKKTIEAQFLMDTLSNPTFTVTNQGGAVYLTINSNNYSGPIRVKWPSSVSPDNTNADVDMSAWRNTNETAGEVFQGEAHHTYTLFFVKGSDANINDGFSVERGN